MYLLRSFILCLLAAYLLSFTGDPGPAPAAGVPLALAQQRKALLSKLHYQLHFTIPAAKELPVQGTALISFFTKDNSRQVVLDFKQAPGAVKQVMVNGKKEMVRHENEHIIIATRYLVKGLNKVKIIFEAGSGALNRNSDYMYALFVPERARTAFPCFDQPDLKATFELTLAVPKGWNAMSNGAVVTTTAKDATKEWQFEPSDTISTYLFSFTAGKYKSETRTVNGRTMQFLYRETDSVKLAASMQAIFDMHGQSLRFLEKYTNIPFPFKKFSFAAIPDFQFGGMEHPGAIWYNANSLFLDSSATRTQLIRRAGLIAHETSHMWFGDLVTMQWFNDVWMKEVFANFMADKIVSEILPDENAGLKFMTEHFPAAYSVDRTKGANPIRQPLDNLNEAGTLYGNIIYHKAPIMMQQLERLIGEKALQNGLRVYLRRYAFANATWPDLIGILDDATPHDLAAWNDSWVNKPGRRVVNELLTDVKSNTYGLFSIDTSALADIPDIKDPVLRAFLWLNLFENVIEGRYITPVQWLSYVGQGLKDEKEELIIQLLLNELQSIWWVYMSAAQREAEGERWQHSLLQFMKEASKPGIKKMFFKSLVGIGFGKEANDLIYSIWKQKAPPEGVKLTDDEYTDLAAELAIKRHPAATAILQEQLTRITNPDKKMRWEFLLPSLAADEQVRDRFFESLKDVKNRRKEAWVNTAVAYLHHPLRESSAVKYIKPSLDLLQEIQQTGDIFFPANWLQATLGNHQSAEAEKIVQDFIDNHPGYNSRLLNKLLQAADPLFRARKVQGQPH
jgi:aminopeptidase N